MYYYKKIIFIILLYYVILVKIINFQYIIVNEKEIN